MSYHRGERLAEPYRAADREGYRFVASNTTHPDVMEVLIDGAVAAEADSVLWFEPDTADYLGNGDAATGLDDTHAPVRTQSEALGVGVFRNVAHVGPRTTS